MSCCSVFDGDRPSVCHESIRRARREWRCCECGEPIVPGARYQEDRGVWEGEWRVFRTCLACAAMRADLCSRGWVYGDLREAIGECLGIDPYEDPEEVEP